MRENRIHGRATDDTNSGDTYKKTVCALVHLKDDCRKRGFERIESAHQDDHESVKGVDDSNVTSRPCKDKRLLPVGENQSE